MSEPIAPTPAGAQRPPALFERLFGRMRAAYLPVLVTYFCYGASGITAIALLFFQKEALGITPAEAATIAFWVALPWSTKMVAGVASDVYPILGSRRKSYLLLGALCSLVGYGWLATAVHSKAALMAALVVVTIGFMVQDVVADALSVEVARDDEEIAQVQALGRMALLVGSISVGYLSGWLSGAIGARATFGVAMILPALVVVAALFVRAAPAPAAAQGRADGPLGAGKAR